MNNVIKSDEHPKPNFESDTQMREREPHDNDNQNHQRPRGTNTQSSIVCPHSHTDYIGLIILDMDNFYISSENYPRHNNVTKYILPLIKIIE